MSEVEGKFGHYLCDVCKDTEMFGCEEDWERLGNDKDCCVGCLVEIKNEALGLLEQFRCIDEKVDEFITRIDKKCLG